MCVLPAPQQPPCSLDGHCALRWTGQSSLLVEKEWEGKSDLSTTGFSCWLPVALRERTMTWSNSCGPECLGRREKSRDNGSSSWSKTREREGAWKSCGLLLAAAPGGSAQIPLRFQTGHWSLSQSSAPQGAAGMVLILEALGWTPSGGMGWDEMGEKRAGRKHSVPCEEGQPEEGGGQQALKRKRIAERINPKTGLVLQQFNEDTVKLSF